MKICHGLQKIATACIHYWGRTRVTREGTPLQQWPSCFCVHAPQASRFFHFNIQNFRNVTASGVHAPLPPGEILDPPRMCVLRYEVSVIKPVARRTVHSTVDYA